MLNLMPWLSGLALVSVLAVVPSPAAAAESVGIRVEDLHELRSVGQVRISPDTKKILYTVVSRQGERHATSRLWLFDVDAGKPAPLLDGDASGSTARWSPDGKWIAFVGVRAGQTGLLVVRPDGRGERVLAPLTSTNHPLPSRGERIAWSPDSGSIAFVSATPGPETEAAEGDPRVITRYLYKPTAGEGQTRFNDNRRLHVFVVDVASTRVRQLTDGAHYEHSLDWSPLGDEIVFVSNREPDPDRFFNYDVFAVRVVDGEVRRITRTETIEYQPRWSPDGTQIAFQGTRRGLTSSETTMEDTHIWLMDADGGNRRELGATIDNRQRSHGWTPDGGAVLCVVQERGEAKLYRLPVAGGKPQLVLDAMGGRGASWSIGGRDMIAFSSGSRSDLPQLHLMSGEGEPRQLTHLNREVLSDREIADVESITLRSFDDLEVEAFLTHPLGRTPASRHPLIVSIKGGPHSQSGPFFDHRAQVYAARGWASLMVNYRGSTGYGQAFADAIFGDQNGGEAQDVLYAVDAAIRRHPWIDRESLAIQGGSYGGQLSMWLITQTRRFKAAIPMYGISNLLSFNYMAYYHDYLAVEFGGFPHQGDLMDRLWERSALKHVAQVTTPTLLVHGENDNDVPIAESEQFYIALKDVGVETVMLRYPREGHGVREIGHQIDLLKRSIDWYSRHFE